AALAAARRPRPGRRSVLVPVAVLVVVLVVVVVFVLVVVRLVLGLERGLGRGDERLRVGLGGLLAGELGDQLAHGLVAREHEAVVGHPLLAHVPHERADVLTPLGREEPQGLVSSALVSCVPRTSRRRSRTRSRFTPRSAVSSSSRSNSSRCPRASSR